MIEFVIWKAGNNVAYMFYFYAKTRTFHNKNSNTYFCVYMLCNSSQLNKKIWYELEYIGAQANNCGHYEMFVVCVLCTDCRSVIIINQALVAAASAEAVAI